MSLVSPQRVLAAEYNIAYVAEVRGGSDLAVYVHVLDHLSLADPLAAFIVDRTRRRITAALRGLVGVPLDARRTG